MRLSQAQSAAPTGALALEDGTVMTGVGFGAVGSAVGEVCFNTAMTGYQEILTDPSYAGQIVTFTFPHIGNVGANDEDLENGSSEGASAARGAVMREPPTSPSNYRSRLDLPQWMRRRGVVGLAGVDTRALTARIREHGMAKATIVHAPAGLPNAESLVERARSWAGIENADLAKDVTTVAGHAPFETAWTWDRGYGARAGDGPHIVVIDFGVKKNILRLLASAGARLTVVPATATAEAIAALKPDGVVLSNGPGDPAATATYAAPTIRALMDADTPILGICLGHQLLALALGAKTVKMAQGHHGANHPVKNMATGAVEIVSMNHGFTVDPQSLPDGVDATFVSLFDGTNSGLCVVGKRAVSVQHHPEASP
ncbi:MAG: glutamine-hydrolyzing carbamoyl-phosphate synthase small subunit, partial [Pseudomonadota bacterium]